MPSDPKDERIKNFVIVQNFFDPLQFLSFFSEQHELIIYLKNRVVKNWNRLSECVIENLICGCSPAIFVYLALGNFAILKSTFKI
ncbi:hypothetical protein BpHYR1_024383 [Brachionus plicatilis]|uniref:Uncharacterized protein n=1 Tax=Brachionus plicatilis TaxID=10195 RepID=A0A3M7PDS9_BRAPC|nr:hypothetical protein BpHYR1_024383 [Brachionus plicatilis]